MCVTVFASFTYLLTSSGRHAQTYDTRVQSKILASRI